MFLSTNKQQKYNVKRTVDKDVKSRILKGKKLELHIVKIARNIKGALDN